MDAASGEADELNHPIYRLPMKTKVITLVLACSGLCAVVLAKDYSPAEIEERSIHRRAVEAVIWGMPAVNTDLMLQEMLAKTGGKVNEIVYWSRPVDWHNQTLTPNPDAIYFMIFYNTKETGPLVIDVPPADDGIFAGNIDTVWQMPVEDVGPYGADQGKGGKYLILPPNQKDEPPPGYFVLRPDTYTGYALIRSNLKSHSEEDIAAAVRYGKRLKVYLLSQAANPPETKFTDAKDVLYDSTIPYDFRFFQSLDRVIQADPWLTRDKAMIDPLKSIGIEKGKPFNPSPATVATLNAAAVEAHAFLEQMYEKGFPPYFAHAYWAMPAWPALVMAGSSGYAETDIYPVDARALTYSIGYIGIKRLGTAQFYLISGKDHNGRALEGSKTYRLVVPPKAPTSQYWSVTVYDRQTHALVKGLDRASRASNASELKQNADGSVDVYFGPKAPTGQESNWVPTDAKRKFELLFRVYGPEKAFFEKKWPLPDVEEVK